MNFIDPPVDLATIYVVGCPPFCTKRQTTGISHGNSTCRRNGRGTAHRRRPVQRATTPLPNFFYNNWRHIRTYVYILRYERRKRRNDLHRRRDTSISAMVTAGGGVRIVENAGEGEHRHHDVCQGSIGLSCVGQCVGQRVRV